MAKLWIKGSIKHPGALRAQLGVKGKIPRERLTGIVSRLRAKAKKGKLAANELTLLRRSLLALRLRGFAKRT